MTKQIVKRNLPLNVKYTGIDKKYIPLADGCGGTCDNCGKLIANIATVKSENGTKIILIEPGEFTKEMIDKLEERDVTVIECKNPDKVKILSDKDFSFLCLH